MTRKCFAISSLGLPSEGMSLTSQLTPQTRLKWDIEGDTVEGRVRVLRLHKRGRARDVDGGARALHAPPPPLR